MHFSGYHSREATRPFPFPFLMFFRFSSFSFPLSIVLARNLFWLHLLYRIVCGSCIVLFLFSAWYCIPQYVFPSLYGISPLYGSGIVLFPLRIVSRIVVWLPAFDSSGILHNILPFPHCFRTV